MTDRSRRSGAARIKPLTGSRWADFERFMGPKGGVGGCWCMLWRLKKADYDRAIGDGNQEAMKSLVDRGPPPGLLAYDGDQPVGWLSIAPRRAFVRLETSRVLKPVDDEDVWSISCFLIAKSHRQRGIAVDLLEAGCHFAREQGGKIVEGYPIDPSKKPYPVAYAWTGFETIFERAGFSEIARRSPTRPIMRKALI